MSVASATSDDPTDTAALEAYLREHIAGFAGPIHVTRFKGGQSNPTYLLGTPQRQYVMRCKPAPVAQLLPSAHAVEREFRLQSALAGSAVPVAGMHCLCEDESVIGRAFYVMDFIEGRIFWEQSLPVPGAALMRPPATGNRCPTARSLASCARSPCSRSLAATDVPASFPGSRSARCGISSVGSKPSFLSTMALA